jgi:hypothetical protein
MLGEGYALWRSLEEIGFVIPLVHRDVKRPGKSPGYRVGLGEDGFPQLVQEMDGESMARLWCHREGKQNAFPVVKVQHALWAVRVDDEVRSSFEARRKNEQKDRLKLLREVIDSREFQLSEKDLQNWMRLRNKATEWLSIFADADEQYLALPRMLQRFIKPTVPPADFLQHLGQLIVQQLQLGLLQDLTLAAKLLIGVVDAKQPMRPAKAEVPLAFDVAEHAYPVPVASAGMEMYFIRRLLTWEERDPDGICALENKPRQLLRKRFPEPQLGTLGETKLFSKNKDAACEFRYLKNPADWGDASKSFPIGEGIANEIASGLRELTDSRLKGKTWRMVANGRWEGKGRNKREKKDLLVVYCEGQPVISEEAADLFGSDEREKREQFANDAQALCRALDGIMKHRPQSRLHLLLIGKADKEKKQILLHMTPTAKEIVSAVERWVREVGENLPELVMYLPPKEKGQNPIQIQPLPTHPDRVVRLLSSKWVRGGLEEVKLQGPSLRQVLDVMFLTPGKWQQETNNLLNLTINRVGQLLVGVAAAFNSRDREKLNKFQSDGREAALRGVALLGILLAALDRKKEVYMDDTAFQLGRLLSLADALHREYCLHVRKGSIPSQLLGNALMAAAADNPEEAVDRLRERLSIYQAWATKVSGEEYRLVKWLMGQIGEICAVIRRPLPKATDQTFRAELFLGYLARPPKENE